jgi:CDP-glucose 4,6-dehydratase
MAAARWRDRGVLLTGGNGFIGSWVARGLVKAGARTVVLVRDQVPRGGLELQGVADRVTRVSGDLADVGLLQRVLAEHEVSIVFHLAAQALVGVGDRSPVGTFATNATGTVHLLEACRLSGVEHVVLASSDKAYGAAPRLPYREDMPLLGASPYEASKACAEIVARSYAQTYGLKIGVTRCANVYGGGDTNFSRLVPDTVRAVLRGQRPVLRSDGSPRRDYIHAEDAVAAYLALGVHCLDAMAPGEVEAFNFGRGEPVRVLELVRLILAAAERADLEPVVGDGARGEIQDQWLDSTRARERLGWEARVSLPDGLVRTVEWYRGYLGAELQPAEQSP